MLLVSEWCCENQAILTHINTFLSSYQGDCCPTNDGFGYLDCCEAVGDECLDGNCTFTETSDYLEFLAGDTDASSINSGAAWSSCRLSTTMVVILSTLMVAAVWW